ncbi:monocarboxylate transporter 12 isoform X3 [Parasteatoda tepidariorum]|uniref:monocarboxylate transporter 12 isoform X3 n=1 Tax=Parasteatoda tepidariorum TaxID=114398 RepID=UPI0039BD4A6C
MYKLEEPDKGYAWVVALAACIVNMILSGITRMIGILYVAIIDEYEVTRQEASVPFTVRNAIRYLSGPIVGVLGQIFGIRTVTFVGGVVAAAGSILSCFAPTVPWITVFWGLIHGIGFSLGNTLFQVVVNQYFEKYRATASGIVLSGACIGSFVYPIMMESILDYYGIFGCFLLLGGIFLNVLPPSLILKSPMWIEHPALYKKRKRKRKWNENRNGSENKKSSDSNNKRVSDQQKKDESDLTEHFLQSLKDIVLLYRNPVYILISLGVASYFWVFLPILTVVVDYSRDKGIPGEYEKYLFHALTVGDLVGRLCFGWVTDKKILSFPIFMMLTFILQGLFTSLFPFATNFWLYMACLVLYGITAGIVFVHFPVLVYKYIDQTKQSLAVGCVGLISGLVTFGIPPVIGIFRDQVGSYDGLFYLIGFLSIITGSLWLLEPFFLKIAQKINA